MLQHNNIEAVYPDLQKIRLLALQRGYTEQKLLIAAGLSTSLMSRKRRSGARISLSTAAKLAKILECDPLDIVKETPNTPTAGKRLKAFYIDTGAVHILAFKKGLTESELVKKAGTDQNLISRARHTNKRTSAENIIKLAKILECDPLDIVKNPQGGEDNAEG